MLAESKTVANVTVVLVRVYFCTLPPLATTRAILSKMYVTPIGVLAVGRGRVC